MTTLLPYHIWLDVYQDEIADKEITDTYSAYQEYRDSFYEEYIDSTSYIH